MDTVELLLKLLARSFPIFCFVWWIATQEASSRPKTVRGSVGTREASSRPGTVRGSVGTREVFNCRRAGGSVTGDSEKRWWNFDQRAKAQVELPGSALRAHPLWDWWLDGSSPTAGASRPASSLARDVLEGSPRRPLPRAWLMFTHFSPGAPVTAPEWIRGHWPVAARCGVGPGQNLVEAQRAAVVMSGSVARLEDAPQSRTRGESAATRAQGHTDVDPGHPRCAGNPRRTACSAIGL